MNPTTTSTSATPSSAPMATHDETKLFALCANGPEKIPPGTTPRIIDKMTVNSRYTMFPMARLRTNPTGTPPRLIMRLDTLSRYKIVANR